ncbi:heterodisulfide reductase-related iron-sulfur binding cluster [Chloroflexota bacterium]
MVFHDSCYLGRHNQIYDAPRRLLSGYAGLNLVELDRSRQRGFCCGGGGAGIWLEHEPGQRINELRIGQILEPEPDLLAVACPFCPIMLDEARSGTAPALALQDIAEVIADAL